MKKILPIFALTGMLMANTPVKAYNFTKHHIEPALMTALAALPMTLCYAAIADSSDDVHMTEKEAKKEMTTNFKRSAAILGTILLLGDKLGNIGLTVLALAYQGTSMYAAITGVEYCKAKQEKQDMQLTKNRTKL